MEHAYGRAPDYTIGVEEELLLVDPATRGLSHGSSELIDAMGVEERAARHDIYEAQIELGSPVCGTAAEAVAGISGLRRRLREVGGTPLGAGIHPSAPFGEVVITDTERYRAEERNLRGLLRRTPDCALHVHVGMPDPDTAVSAFNGLREHLPVLCALGGNSPYWHGLDSGLSSARIVLRRGFPRVEAPRAFRDFEDYTDTVDTILAAGGLPDYTFIWWDIRLHPRLGTVELRVMDGQSSLERAVAIAALVHGLAKREAEGRSGGYRTREELSESGFRAAAHGLEASLLDGDRMRPVGELAREAVELARPHARELGSEEPLEGIERILREGSGADRQRAAHAAGGMEAVLDLLLEETAAPYG
jgi:carboxylate-amine ligase